MHKNHYVYKIAKLKLIGGFPEGSLIGQDSYVVASNDCASSTEPEDRYRYIDDLEITDLICLAGILIEYDCWSHVPSYVGVDQMFLKPEKTNTQYNLNKIQTWTADKLMKINSSKSNYVIFSWSSEHFATRLSIDGEKIDRKFAVKILGVWISEDAGDWSRNTT